MSAQTASISTRFASMFEEASAYFCALPKTIGTEPAIVLSRALAEDMTSSPEALAAIWKQEIDGTEVDMELIQFAITMRGKLGEEWPVLLLAEEERDWAADRRDDLGEDDGNDDAIADARFRWEGCCAEFDRKRDQEAVAVKRWLLRTAKAA